MYKIFSNFLNPETCLEHISNIDELFTKNNMSCDNIEKYNRLRINDKNLTLQIESKLKNSLNMDFKVNNLWFPTKYTKGGFLDIHQDGSVDIDDKKSNYTILIYLNQDFSGGRTILVDSFDKKDIIKIVEPKIGLCLLLKQDVLHYGELVDNGLKYILRGDLYVHKNL